MNIDEIIRNSFTKLKNDIEKFPEIFDREHTICARLYYHICSNFDEIDKSDMFKNIRLECDYVHYGMTTKSEILCDENKRNEKMWQCVKDNYPDNNHPTMKKVGKAGNYDLAILDDENRLSHVIEIKLLKGQGFTDSNRHRAYEDIYVLSRDFLGEECDSSLFVMLIHGKNRKEYEIHELFKSMEATYKKAGLTNFESCAVVDWK